MSTLHELKYFAWPPLPSVFFGMAPPFKAVFWGWPPQIPPARPPHLVKNERSLSNFVPRVLSNWMTNKCSNCVVCVKKVPCFSFFSRPLHPRIVWLLIMNEKKGGNLIYLQITWYMYYLRQLTILHYITELFVSHSAIGLAIHVNNLLYLITWQMRLSTTAKAQAANKLQGNKTKQNNLPWPSTIATLSNQDHGGNENVSKECIQTTAVNHSKESSWIYALLNFKVAHIDKSAVTF